MSARSRANGGSVEDVGRASSPAALQLVLLLIFLPKQPHSITDECQIPKSRSTAAGEGARPTPAFCTTRATVISWTL